MNYIMNSLADPRLWTLVDLQCNRPMAGAESNKLLPYQDTTMDEELNYINMLLILLQLRAM